MKMTDNVAVVGGVYHEACVFPWRKAVLGSGGRAACVLANLGCTVHLFSAADSATESTFLPIADSFLRIQCSFERLERSAGFFYSHPLAQPIIRQPRRITEGETPNPLSVGNVLYFGMLEGVPHISADTVVYDPQDPGRPSWFRTTGTAKRLAYILNAEEAKLLSGETTANSAAALIAAKENAEVVIIKRGPRGSLLWTRERVEEIPCYRTPAVYKIGSGDIFSAVFFFEWAINGQPPLEAAHAAARATATYCATGGEPQVISPGCYATERILWAAAPKAPLTSKQVYLAGPFFTTPQRWLITEAYRILTAFGLSVFSPFHNIGLGPPEKVVNKDLAGIDNSSLVYAIIDGADYGTLFEIGYAKAKGIEVIALAESQSQEGESLTMLAGSGCHLYHDFAALLYECCWA